MRQIIVVIILLYFEPLLAQQKYTAIYNPSWKYANVADSNHEYSADEKKKRNTKFLFSFDSRNSHMSGEWAKIFGVRFGMEFAQRYRWGLGVYSLREPLQLTERTVLDKKITPVMQEFAYTAWFTEYLFHHDYRWTAGVMMSYGNGRAKIGLYDRDMNLDSVIAVNKIPIFALNVNGYYHVTPWLAPGVGLGYRWVRGDDDRLRQGFEAPFYVFKVKFMLGRLFKTIFKPEIIREEKKAFLEKKAWKKAKRKGHTTNE